MTTTKIRFATQILARLGEELNPSPDQSILELVKNAFDANARSCTIELVGATVAGGTVRVVDDGDGMSDGEIRDSWLVLGRSDKDHSKPTRLGRIPVGSKGLGRLAALRLGHVAKIVSTPAKNNSSTYSLVIDWDLYDSEQLVDDVPLTIQTIVEKNKPAGTEVRIEKTRNALREEDVRRLARALILLADPFGDPAHGFQPVLLASEFRELELLVKGRYFDKADFHLIASVDANGKGGAKLVDWSGKTLYEAEHDDLRGLKGPDIYACPAATFDLWNFLLSKETQFKVRDVPSADLKEWLKAFGGVHVYQDGFRVAPYGNPGNDWLEMNLLRAQSPEERPSTNNSIGRVVLTGGAARRLIQKTDRVGFIENAEYDELRRFLRDCLRWMSRRRMDEATVRRRRERETAYESSRESREKVSKAINQAPPKVKRQLTIAFDEYEKSRNKESRGLRKEIQLYRTLATAGIAAATLAHETQGNPFKAMRLAISSIERRTKAGLEQKEYEEKLRGPIGSIRKALDALSVLGVATLSLVQGRKRRVGRVDLHPAIEEVLGIYRPFLEEQKIETLVELSEGAPFLKASNAAIESVVANLLSNAIFALEGKVSGLRQIRVRTNIQGKELTLRVADSGRGIKDIRVADIWSPGESTRADGTGLGLTIVRDTVGDLGGSVLVVANSDLGGAEFKITLPILGS